MNTVHVLYVCLCMIMCVVKRFLSLYPATDMLLEELALNSAGSESVSENRSNDTTDGEVKQMSNLHCTITFF